MAHEEIVVASQRLLDNTLLETAERCEVEAVLRFGQHLDSGRPSAALTLGKAVHAGVRAFYDRPFDTDAMVRAVTAEWADADFGDKEWRSVEYATQIVVMYADVYKPSSWDFELVMNERYLEDETECGIVDRLVRRKSDGQLLVHDLKTSGWYPSPKWQEQWRHSQQAARYLKLAEHHLWVCGARDGDLDGPERIAGFVCDAIYTNKRGYPKPEDFVHVGPFSYSSALRAELDAQRAVRGRRAIAVLDGRETPVKSTKSCFRFNEPCTFLRFCAADPADRQDMLELAEATGELQTKVWNPKERD